MQTVSTPFKKGPQGLAKVVFNKKSVVVTMKDSGQQMTFDLDSLDCPLPKSPMTGDYNVSVSYDLSKLFNIAPYNATVVAKFSKFAAPEGQLPVPKFPANRVGQTRDGTTYEKNYLQFVALLEVMEPDYMAGMTIPVVLRYHFVADTSGNVGIGHLRSKYTEQLMSFLDRASGDISTLALPFSDNVLPALQKELQTRARPISVVVEKGFATAFSEPMVSVKRPAKAKKVVDKVPAKAKKK